MTKITKHKLNGSNFLDWSKTIRIYLQSIKIDDHLNKDPPTDETHRNWMSDDARLFLQIQNSIRTEMISLINHCEFVKELMEYLKFLYSGKAFYRAEKNDRTLTSYFMDFKRAYEELNVLMPFSTDVKTQQARREQMTVMSFLAGLSLEFDSAKSQIFSDFEISSLHDVFIRVLRIESPISSHSTSALVSRNYSSR
ncbi:hypothetical protein MANES_13G089260v8 [Manihot esculenta]|uniref:Uncharacterized protein n=1 Tax=Manihot esculenta TaxID=3983 RepID=A0ACB7GL04_MANES|nr:hypothetical protein MANES_13G089260v8 [Manihot esculenta]